MSSDDFLPKKFKNEFSGLKSFQNFSKFEVEAFLNDLCEKLRNITFKMYTYTMSI